MISIVPESFFEFLNVGDQFQLGDMYGESFCFVIGTDQTGIKPGDVVSESLICYRPRRLRGGNDSRLMRNVAHDDDFLLRAAEACRAIPKEELRRMAIEQTPSMLNSYAPLMPEIIKSEKPSIWTRIKSILGL